jgi:hypothetical protein
MRRTFIIAILLVAVPALAWGSSPKDQETIGVVRNSAGTATVTRGGLDIPVAAGAKLLVEDILHTGLDGSIGIILRDNSTLSIGPGSRLVLRKFLFSPSEGKFGLLVRITRGTMAYISGLIGKLSPESVRFETPVATIGIRGTRFAVKVDE